VTSAPRKQLVETRLVLKITGDAGTGCAEARHIAGWSNQAAQLSVRIAGAEPANDMLPVSPSPLIPQITRGRSLQDARCGFLTAPIVT
jgi:hypothetical protein